MCAKEKENMFDRQLKLLAFKITLQTLHFTHLSSTMLKLEILAMKIVKCNVKDKKQ
jgi:hypothetical protein